MSEDSGRLLEGQVVADRWEVQHLLGVGELAEVYDIIDRKTGGSAVLKLFAPQYLEVPDAWKGYQTHAEAVRALGLPALINPYAFGIHDASHAPFSVAERASVPALDQLIATVGTLLPAQFARILRELGPLLDAAHHAGVVHRNLKPSNIFCGIQDPRSVRIGDFAVSALRRELSPYPGWGGTPGWVAPEGVNPRSPDHVALDVYAVGLLAFFALTDRSPFLKLATFDPDAFQAELSSPLPKMSDRARQIGVRLDAKFDAWFEQALAVDPAQRFGSVGAMAEALLDLTEQPRTTGGLGAGPNSLQQGSDREAPLGHGPSIRAPALSVDPAVASASVQPLVFNEQLPRAAPAKPQPPPNAGSLSAVSAQEIPRTLPPAPLAAARADTSRTVMLAATGTALIAVVSAVIVAAVLVSERGEPEAAARAAASSGVPATGERPALASGQAAPAKPETLAASPDSSAEAAAAAEAARMANVTFRCSPVPCSALHCDGREYSDTSQAIELAPGEHRCIGSAEGYLPLITTVDVKEGEALTHPLELRPKDAPEPEPTKSAATTKSQKSGTTTKTTKSSAKTKKQKTEPTAKKAACGTFINPCR